MSECRFISEPGKCGSCEARGIVNRIHVWIVGCSREKLFLHDDGNAATRGIVVTAESKGTCKPRVRLGQEDRSRLPLEYRLPLCHDVRVLGPASSSGPFVTDAWTWPLGF